MTAVSAGREHSLVLRGGTVYGWGNNEYGQVGNGTITLNVKTPVTLPGLTSGATAIRAGLTHNLAVRDGAVYAWGRNQAGELGIGTTTSLSVPVRVGGRWTG